jgi:hypothetical protein
VNGASVQDLGLHGRIARQVVDDQVDEPDLLRVVSRPIEQFAERPLRHVSVEPDERADEYAEASPSLTTRTGIGRLAI